MSDFAFLDGFEGYASELPIARLDSRPCRPKAGKVVRQMENLSFLIQLRRPYADAERSARPPSTIRRITQGDRRPGSA